MPRKARKRTTTVKQEVENIYCVNCGAIIDEYSGVLASPDWYADTRFVHYCRACQQRQFEDFAETMGPAMAFILCCASYNLPFIPEAVPRTAYEDESREMNWLAYLQNLEITDYRYRRDGEPASFVEGITDLSVIFGDNFQKDTRFATGIAMDKAASKAPGTRAQRKNWGKQSKWTDDDYDEADRIFSILSAERAKTGMDAQTEFTLREICKLQLDYNKARTEGKHDAAKKIYDTISKMMENNSLRKKDENSQAEAPKLDNFIAKFEKAGYVQNGKILPYDVLLRKLRGDHAKYPMSHDYLDFIIREILNCMRENMGMGKTSVLPAGFQMKPKCGEFEPTMSAAEKKTIRDLKLPPMQYEPKPPRGTKQSKGD